MAEEHWFDTFGRILARGIPRRGVLRSVPLVAAVWLFGGVSVAESAKQKSKNKNKNKNEKTAKDGKQQGKRKPKPKGKPKSCSAGACSAFATRQDRNYCEFICSQCDESDPREFCIVEGAPINPTKVAVCCVEGATCCQGQCCSSEHGSPGNQCCPDVGCVNTDNDNRHCGRCDNACPGGQSCIDGGCVPDQACPPQTTPCGGPNVRQPEACCDSASCMGCESVPDPNDPSVFRAQCVYRCPADQVCLDLGGANGASCCWPPGHGCSPSNPGSVATCCSGQCERDEVSGGNRCL